MGLVPGFVLSVNRRALLAVLAVGISVSYALVAGAAVGGLEEAQSTLASGLSDTDLLASDPDGELFDVGDVQPEPDRGFLTHDAETATIYTVRHGEPVATNDSIAIAGPEGPWSEGETVSIAGENRTVAIEDPPRGASGAWLGVTEAVFADAGGPSEGVEVAVFEDAADWLARDLQAQGFAVHEAPATFPFYTAGSLELVSAVSVTVVASALVVALLTSAIVSMELKAKRSSFATLQVYAGSGLVRRLVAARGAAILTAGHAVGLGATFGLLFVLERAGAVELALPGGYLATALGATFGGGLLGLVRPVYRAGQPLSADELGASEAPIDLPAPLRFTLTSWRTVVPLAISAMVLAGSLGVVYGAVDMPRQLFGSDEAEVLADTSDNPLRGSVGAFPGFHLGEVDGYEGSSPEIFAPTVVEAQPVMVRGIDWDRLRTLDPVTLTRGKAVSSHGEAVLGARLADRLDASLGDELTLPAPYSSHTETVEVVGIAQSPRLLGDEILVSLSTARSLNPIPEDEVTLVRYRHAEDGRGAAELPDGIEATDLTVLPETPVPRQEAVARVELVNFADHTEGRHLTLTVDGSPVGDRWVQLGPRETGVAHIPFRVPAQGLLDLQVNPSRTVETGEPAYRIDIPDVVVNDTTVEVTVREEDGDPAGGVRVALGDTEVRTSEDGTAMLHALGVGNRTLSAEGPDGHGARSVVVVDRADQHRSRLLVEEVNGPRYLENNRWAGAIIVQNVGGEAFEGPLDIPVDGEERNVGSLRLLAGERVRLPISLFLEPGDHVVGEGSWAIEVTIGSTPAQAAGDDQDEASSGEDGNGSAGEATSGQDIRSLLQQRDQQPASGSETVEAQALDAFIADTFENFDAAVTLVTIATVLHAGLIGLVAVRRDVEENADNLATMATVGADRQDLRRRALREFTIVGGVATVIGVAAGLALVALAASQGWIRGFGHALVPRTSLGFALRVGVVSLLVILAWVVLAVEQVGARSPGSLLSEGPQRSARPPLAKLIGGEA